jgi:subtilisin family serine protease
MGTVAAAPDPGDQQHVIIVMKERPASGSGPAELASFAAESQRDLISSLTKKGSPEIIPLWSVNAIATSLTEDEIQSVAARPDVERVVPDRIVTLDLLSESEEAGKGDRGMRFFRPVSDQIESIDPAYPAEDEIAWGVAWIEAPEVWANGFDGTGVTVAVVDTGIFAEHPDLAGKVVGWDDLVNYQTQPYDDNGHGTHCAGTVAGTGAGGIYTGVAPGANLIGVKVFNAGANGTTSAVIRGFERAVELGADIISYSGGSRWIDDFWQYDLIDSPAGLTQTIQVLNENDGYDPSFMIVWVETPRYADLDLTMRKPDGTIYPGVDCDWYDTPVPAHRGMVKFIGDEALTPGNWTLNVNLPSLNRSNTVWFSGRGDDLDNILYQRFDFYDYLGALDSATFQMSTWYDIEEDYDYGYLEVYNVEWDTWDILLEFTGDGRGIYSADLSDYLWQQDGQYTLMYVDIRLRYETDSSDEWMGWYVDWMAIPEIGFYDDASGESGWELDPEEDGWSRIAEEYPVWYDGIIFYTDNGTSLQSQTVNGIVGNGTVFVTSAGNDGELGLRTISGPAAEEAIIVGATENMGDYIAYYSSRGPAGWGDKQMLKPDVVAPGSSVLSTSRSGGYTTMSGTSMACPHVAGIAALLLDGNSTLTPADVKTIITETAVDLGPVGPDTDYGYGRVSAWAAMEAVTPLQPPGYNAPQLHAGFGYNYLKPGESNVITAISWNRTPVIDETIFFRVWNSTGEAVNRTVLTNASGLATASFVPGAGEYNYLVSDTHGNTVRGWISGYNAYQPPTFLIDTPWKMYQAVKNTTVPVKYTVVDPLTMEPYAGDIRMVVYSGYGPHMVEYFNQTLTPVNGTIQADINGSLITTMEADIVLSPVANLSQSLWPGWIDIYDENWPIVEVSPVVSWATPKGNATVLVKQYAALDASPVQDGMYQLPVAWLYEADVRALSRDFPDQTVKLLAGEIKEVLPEYRELFSAIDNMQEDIRYIPYQSMNGIGKVTIPVPDGAYIGVVFSEDYYDEGPHAVQSPYYGFSSFILVNLNPFTYHSTAPYSEPERYLSVWGEWNGAYSPDMKSIVPGDTMDVTCYLQNSETYAPLQGTVYLYTSDQSATVLIGPDGYGYATFPAPLRSESSWSGNGLQIVGLSGDAYSYNYVYPPFEQPFLSGEYVASGGAGMLSGEVAIFDPAGNPIPMPGIFEVERQDVASGESYSSHGSTPAATLLSRYINGAGEFAGTVPYGSYQLNVALKDYFYQGVFSQGNWWSNSIFIGASPLNVLTPPPECVGQPGHVDVTVRMSNGEAGVPVYLTYDTLGRDRYYYEYTGVPFEEFGGVDIKTTGADGSAILRMYMPKDRWLYWEIGGGTADRVFTALSGYSSQETPVEIRGDLNGNGRVDIGDLSRVAWMAAGLTPIDMRADFNGDGKVDGADAALIAYYYVGKINVL